MRPYVERDEVVLMPTQTGSIDLKATSGFKTYADGSFATQGQVTSLGTAIESNAQAISLRATKTEAYQLAQPNLSPFFESTPYRTTTTYDGGYWQATGDNWLMGGVTHLSEGWAHISRAASTRLEIAIPRIESIDSSKRYTLLFEWRDITVTGSPNLYARNYPQSCQFTSNSYNCSWTTSSPTSGTKYVTMTVDTTAKLTSAWQAAINLGMNNGSGVSFEGDLRLSLYEGEYTGPYKPYSGTQLYASQSELKVTTEGISSEVSKISSAKYLTSSTASWTLANIKVYAADGCTAGWGVTSTANVRVGDTAYVKGFDSTRQCNVYIKGTVTAVTSSTSLTMTAHGYEDVLPVNTIKSTINQSADSVKIAANHIAIDGTTTFSNTTLASYLSSNYDAKGAADAVQVGVRNLLGGTDNIPSGSVVMNLDSASTFGDIGNYNDPISLYSFEDYDEYSSAVVWTTTSTGNRGVGYYTKPGEIAAGTEYTFSCRVKSSVATTIHTHTAWRNGSATAGYMGWTSAGNLSVAANVWTDYSYTFVPDNLAQLRWEFFVAICFTGSSGGITFRVAHAKLEKGNRATDWTPAPEDLTSSQQSISRGRNYILNSAGVNGDHLTSGNEYIAINVGQSYMDVAHGTQVTISFDLYMPVNTANPTITVYNTNNKGPKAFSFSPVGTGATGGITKSFTAAAGSTIDERVSVTGYINDRSSPSVTNNFLEFYSVYNTGNVIRISNLKLEIGKRATDWTPAPEDSTSQEQRVYYRTANSTAPAAPTAWVTSEATANNTWTTKRMQYDSTYKYLYTCIQRQTVGGKITNTTVLLDDTTTVIDGGNIITGSVKANKLDATDINASNSLTIGALSTTTQSDILNSNIVVGVKNLLMGTSAMKAGTGARSSGTFRASGGTLSNVTTTSLPVSGVTGALRVTNSGSSAANIGFAQDDDSDTDIKAGETYVQSAWIRASESMEAYFQLLYGSGTPITSINNNVAGKRFSVTTDWQQFSFSGTLDSPQKTRYGRGYVYGVNVPVNGWIEVCGLKLERGNKASDWSLAEEDVDNRLKSGESALTKVNYYSRSCMVGQSGSTYTNPWYKFASSYITAQYIDRIIVFDVYNNGGFVSNNVGSMLCGRLTAHFRAGSGINSVDGPFFVWDRRGSDINLSDFVLAYKLTAGSRIDAELWVKCNRSYAGYTFQVVYDSDRTTNNETAFWTLYNTFTAGSQSAITSGYTQVTSTDGDAARGVAENYIYASSSGIRIASASPSSQNMRMELTNSAMDMYTADGNKRLHVSSSDGITVGRTDKEHIAITDDAMTIYDNSNKARTVVNSSGLDIRDTDGTTSVANFGASARIGKANGDRVTVDSANGITIYKGNSKRIQTTANGMDVYGSDGTTSIASFGATTRIGPSAGPKVSIDTSSVSLGDTNGALELSVIPADGSDPGYNWLLSSQDLYIEQTTSTHYNRVYVGSTGVDIYSANSQATKSALISVEGDTGDVGILTDGGDITLAAGAGTIVDTPGGKSFDLGRPTVDGRYTSISGSTTLSSGTAKAVTSLQLDPGLYLIYGWVSFASNATGRRAISLTTTTGNIDTSKNSVTQQATNGAFTGMTISTLSYLSSTTTIFLNATQNSGGNLSTSGLIRAVSLV